MANVNPLRLSDDDFDPNAARLDMGTPGGFEENFVDTLIAQLEAAGISERTPSQSQPWDQGRARAEHVRDDDEKEVWTGMRSNVGVPRLKVRVTG